MIYVAFLFGGFLGYLGIRTTKRVDKKKVDPIVEHQKYPPHKH